MRFSDGPLGSRPGRRWLLFESPRSPAPAERGPARALCSVCETRHPKRRYPPELPIPGLRGAGRRRRLGQPKRAYPDRSRPGPLSNRPGCGVAGFAAPKFPAADLEAPTGNTPIPLCVGISPLIVRYGPRSCKQQHQPTPPTSHHASGHPPMRAKMSAKTNPRAGKAPAMDTSQRPTGRAVRASDGREVALGDVYVHRPSACSQRRPRVSLVLLQVNDDMASRRRRRFSAVSSWIGHAPPLWCRPPLPRDGGSCSSSLLFCFLPLPAKLDCDSPSQMLEVYGRTSRWDHDLDVRGADLTEQFVH